VRHLLVASACLLPIACGSAGQTGDRGTDASAAGDSGATRDLPPPLDLAASPDLAFVDLDADGLDDRQELAWAAAYLPYLSISPNDGCDTMGLLVRVSPHPMDPTLIHIIYDQLYDQDCGLGGHVGDDEVFAVTIDPATPPPAGIVAIKAISHQGTACERDTTCGRCSGQTACQTLDKAGVAWPAVWPSRAKHGSYVDRSMTCTLFTTCLDSCDDNPSPRQPPIVNAGEPGHPLVHDLTTDGFITTQNGWKNMQLFHWDPWVSMNFGGAGDISKDLVDPAFDTPACH
jgi:hypothetical protein